MCLDGHQPLQQEDAQAAARLIAEATDADEYGVDTPHVIQTLRSFVVAATSVVLLMAVIATHWTKLMMVVVLSAVLLVRRTCDVRITEQFGEGAQKIAIIWVTDADVEDQGGDSDDNEILDQGGDIDDDDDDSDDSRPQTPLRRTRSPSRTPSRTRSPSPGPRWSPSTLVPVSSPAAYLPSSWVVQDDHTEMPRNWYGASQNPEHHMRRAEPGSEPRPPGFSCMLNKGCNWYAKKCAKIGKPGHLPRNYRPEGTLCQKGQTVKGRLRVRAPLVLQETGPTLPQFVEALLLRKGYQSQAFSKIVIDQQTKRCAPADAFYGLPVEQVGANQFMCYGECRRVLNISESAIAKEQSSAMCRKCEKRRACTEDAHRFLLHKFNAMRNCTKSKNLPRTRADKIPDVAWASYEDFEQWVISELLKAKGCDQYLLMLGIESKLVLEGKNARSLSVERLVTKGPKGGYCPNNCILISRCLQAPDGLVE
jgi:hypothetical protein